MAEPLELEDIEGCTCTNCRLARIENRIGALSRRLRKLARQKKDESHSC